MPLQRHHLLFDRNAWESRVEAKSLRTDVSLIAPIEGADHSELHRICPTVPLLGYHALRRVGDMYERGKTPLASADNLMTAIEQAANHPRAHIIEKHLAELSIWSLDLQRPFLADLKYR